MKRAHCLENLGSLAGHGAKAPVCRRLHCQQSNFLEQMVLDHIAQTLQGFVKGTALLHAEILREGYLRAIDTFFALFIGNILA